MKTIFLAVAMLCITTSASFAQNANNVNAPVGRDKMIEDARVNAAKETETLDKQLHLTDKQKAAMNGINLKYAIVAQQNASPENKIQFKKMKEDAVKRELTPEQFEKYKAITK